MSGEAVIFTAACTIMSVAMFVSGALDLTTASIASHGKRFVVSAIAAFFAGVLFMAAAFVQLLA